MTLSNEQLMWMSIAIWVVFVLILGYYAFFGGSKSALPSGNTAQTGGVLSS